MKKATAFLVFIFLVSGTSAFAADTLKIGVVNLIRALNESEAGIKAKTDLELMIKSKQTAIDEKGKAIEKAKSDMENQASVLTPEGRKAKGEEIERLLREYQRMVSDSKDELKKKEGELTGGILKELRDIIGKMGKDDDYAIILENSENQALYTAKTSDLTDIVVKKYNESTAKRTTK